MLSPYSKSIAYRLVKLYTYCLIKLSALCIQIGGGSFGTNVEKLSMIARVTTFFATLMNCDLNMYSHISYRPLQDCDYRQKKLTKQLIYARINVFIV